ncbi:MAG: CsbD family protein [Acidobacteria bacterium]|nr:CsbD family protein [Acidobacteriota bacterium]
MNEDTLKGQWKQLKGNAREQWGKLTDDDLDQVEGRAEQLVGRIQERYGIARDEAQRQYDDWWRTYQTGATAAR